MPNFKYTARKAPSSPNPFRRASIPANHPAVEVVELIVAEVFKQVQVWEESRDNAPLTEGEGRPGTYSSTSPQSMNKSVPENAPKPKATTPNGKAALYQKVKRNIDTYRGSMVKMKSTPSFRDERGNLPVGRGRGKFGVHRGRGVRTRGGRAVCGTPFSSPKFKGVFDALKGQVLAAPVIDFDDEQFVREMPKGRGSSGGGQSVRGQIVTRKVQKALDKEKRDATQTEQEKGFSAGRGRGEQHIVLWQLRGLQILQRLLQQSGTEKGSLLREKIRQSDWVQVFNR